MSHFLDFRIQSQPDDISCGPTCLHAVFRYFGDEMELADVIRKTPKLDDGGTLGVLLGQHALARGYRVKIITYNLRVFDPSWFAATSPAAESDVASDAVDDLVDERTCTVDLVSKLSMQAQRKTGIKLQLACKAYIQFLEAGGQVSMHDLNETLLRHYLSRSVPIMTGLSAPFLYRSPRERQSDMKPDDINGTPTGHFVVLSGYDASNSMVCVADPFIPNPFTRDNYYDVKMDRLVCAILLGVLTYDANLLIIEPSHH